MLGEREEDGEREQELDKGKEIVEEEEGEEMRENRVTVEKRQDELYPAPLVSHEEVARDRSVFMDTLRQFHATMGTKFMYACYFFFYHCFALASFFSSLYFIHTRNGK